MLYRRKFLLALVEILGGSVDATDLEKLLFLFCQSNGKPYYDFFPYKYGCFSLLSYQDKRRLTDLGYLQRRDGFELEQAGSFVAQLSNEDQVALHVFGFKYGALRGKELIRKIYLEYPDFTRRSELTQEVLTEREVADVSAAWNDDQTACLFTLGYEGLSIDAFLARTVLNNIGAVVDVRRNPVSKKYGFSKSKLCEYISMAGSRYYHFPELGIPSELRRGLAGREAFETLFDYYSNHILPEEPEAINKVKGLVEIHRRIVIICFEADYRCCHRHKITEQLEKDEDFGIPIVHLSGPQERGGLGASYSGPIADSPLGGYS